MKVKYRHREILVQIMQGRTRKRGNNEGERERRMKVKGGI
jgi:hypothetical protein